MAMTNEEVIDTLNHLIVTCKDGENGYRTAAEGVNNSELKTLFFTYAQQRARFAEELKSEVRNLGGEPAEDSSLMGKVYHGWMNLKNAVTGGNEATVIAECEKGEDGAVNAYEEALGTSLPSNLQDVVVRQHAQVREAHDRIRNLERATNPGSA